jgi:uncharacterized membrane protein
MPRTDLACRQCGREVSDSARFCTACGAAVEATTAIKPSDTVRGDFAPSPTRRIALVVFPIAVAALIFVFTQYITPSLHPVIRNQPVVAGEQAYDSATVSMVDISAREEGDQLVFSLDDLRRNKLVRFSYSGQKTERAVMAYLASDGRLVTAISLSEHCGSTEFTLKNNMICCARCPSRWDMMTLEAYACCAKYYPDPIPSRVVGREVYVAKNKVEGWAGRL